VPAAAGGAAKAIFTTIKTDKEQAIKDITELFDKWFGLFEAKVPEEGFILGKKFPTVADLVLVNMVMGYMPCGVAAKHAAALVARARVGRAPGLGSVWGGRAELC